jgi:hypothetical protein
MMPEAMAAFIWELAARKNVSPEQAFAYVLFAHSAALPTWLKISPQEHDDKWLVYGRLWILFAIESSGRKSPLHDEVFAIFYVIEDEWEAEHARQMAVIMKETDGKPAKGEIGEAPQLVLQDTTIETAKAVAIENPRGVIMPQDELAVFLSSFGLYGPNNKAKASSDRPQWLRMADGGIVKVTLGGTVGKRVKLCGPASVAIFGGIQPDTLSTFFSKDDGKVDGLYPRFMTIEAQMIPLPKTRRTILRDGAFWPSLAGGKYSIDRCPANIQAFGDLRR